jgi:hypothetical protein
MHKTDEVSEKVCFGSIVWNPVFVPIDSIHLKVSF